MTPRMMLFVVAFIVWCLFNWIPDGAHLLLGIVVAWLVSFPMGKLVFQQTRLMWKPRRYGYFLLHYVPVFLWEVFKANIDVAYRVLHPALPINPGIVKVGTALKSDLALTLLANSITLTPGTMSVDIDADRSALYIHWIDVRSRDMESATRMIAERFESILRKIFEEEVEDETG